MKKSEEEFSFKNIEKGRRRTVCKSCHSDYRKQKYIENKEKELEQVRKIYYGKKICRSMIYKRRYNPRDYWVAETILKIV